MHETGTNWSSRPELCSNANAVFNLYESMPSAEPERCGKWHECQTTHRHTQTHGAHQIDCSESELSAHDPYGTSDDCLNSLNIIAVGVQSHCLNAGIVACARTKCKGRNLQIGDKSITNLQVVDYAHKCCHASHSQHARHACMSPPRPPSLRQFPR